MRCMAPCAGLLVNSCAGLGACSLPGAWIPAYRARIARAVDSGIPSTRHRGPQVRSLVGRQERHAGGARPPVFILGILHRSGTNFLLELLELHSDVAVPAPISEDFFLFHSDELLGYVESVSRQWADDWGVGVDDRAELERGIGDAIISFLHTRVEPSKVLVTKTPSVSNLDNFFRLFPAARLLIVVRDGRAVVESGVRSFVWDYETATRKWADAARTIREFDLRHQSRRDQYRIIRYEDLYERTEKVLRHILEFLGLEIESYDFDRAINLPVRGSSVHRGGAAAVHWKPVEKTEEFNPVERCKHWSARRHRRFNWIAGQELLEFGYRPLYADGGGLFHVVTNRLLDGAWALRQFAALGKREVAGLWERFRSAASRGRSLLGGKRTSE